MRTEPRRARVIRKGWEFDAIFRTGLRVQGDLVRLLFLTDHDSGDAPGVGYAVGKRQGKAVVRTRGRRVLREAFRRLEPYVVCGVRVVLSLRAKGLSANAVAVHRDMAALMLKHGLISADDRGSVFTIGWNDPIPHSLIAVKDAQRPESEKP